MSICTKWVQGIILRDECSVVDRRSGVELTTLLRDGPVDDRVSGLFRRDRLDPPPGSRDGNCHRADARRDRSAAAGRPPIVRLRTGRSARTAGLYSAGLLPEFSAQCRLFKKKNKSKKCQPNDETILQRGDFAEQHPLTKDLRCHDDIHLVAHMAIQSGNHEMNHGACAYQRH